MTISAPIRKPALLSRLVLTGLCIGALLVLLALMACQADIPIPQYSPPPSNGPAVSTVSTEDTPLLASVHVDEKKIPSQGRRDDTIPCGVYAMMDWARVAGAGGGLTYPWVVAGHYAFTWRQVHPRPDILDWDLVDRWLLAEAGTREAPFGKRVGLGVNAYEGGEGDAAPQWVLDNFSIGGYRNPAFALVASTEHEQEDIWPELELALLSPGSTSAVKTVFRPGGAMDARIADTWIGAQEPALSHAGDRILYVGRNGQANILIGIHPLGISPGTKVLSATLRMRVLELRDAAVLPLTIAAYPLRKPWQPSEATWHSPEAGKTWTIRGANGVREVADRSATPAGVGQITGEGLVELPLDAGLVQSWIDTPASNFGIVLKQEAMDTRLPRYWDEGYLEALSSMVRALGERYGDDPRVAWVEISVGIYGETAPANESGLKWAYAEAGLTSTHHEPERGIYSWTDIVRRIIDIYRSAFPGTTLFLQYSNFFESVNERADYVPYAVERGIGLKHNGLYPDSIDGATYGGPAVGTFNIMFTYSNTVPVGWEFQVFPRTESNVYWAMLNALDKRADFVMVQKDAITRTELIPIFKFANRYLGATIEKAPAAWVALRETERPAERWNTQHGNFTFFLSQHDSGRAGKTIPMWKVTEAKEGLFARRTDQDTGNRYMYFDVDDRFFAGGRPIRLSVIYLDTGRDHWHLEYDAGLANPKPLPPVQKSDSGEWKAAQFVVIDAAMRGGLEGFDFRIDCEMDGDEIVHMALLEVLDG